jgi:hypothetical protein
MRVAEEEGKVAMVRGSRFVLLGIVGSGLLSLAQIMTAASAFGDDDLLVMTGTGTPQPDAQVLTDVDQAYIAPDFSGFNPSDPDYSAVGVFTPEQFWPVTPELGNETFGQSVAQGVSDLNNAITAEPSGSDIVAVGYSQSAAIATTEMEDLAAADYPASDLSFVLLADPNNPDGGILERFDGLYIPGLNVDFNGATPSDTPYTTDVYSIQYDGIADCPQYPIDLPADLNALFGYFILHPTYEGLTPEEVASAVVLPTSPGYDGDTTYNMILTQDLPLLDPLRAIPYLGPIAADLVQPDLRVIVDLGYGDGYANVATTAGLLPDANLASVAIDLATGALQGVQAALVDAGVLPTTDLPDAYPYLPDPSPPTEVLGSSATATAEGAFVTELQDFVNDLAGLSTSLDPGAVSDPGAALDLLASIGI